MTAIAESVRSLPPGLALGLLVIALSGSLFHTFFGRTMRGYAATLGVSAIGFAAGEVFARLIDSDGGRFGGVHLVHGLVGAWAAMGVWRWRARIKAEPSTGSR